MTPAALAARLAEGLEDIEHRGEAALVELESLYADDVVFQDPIQTLDGLEAMRAMNRRLLRRARSLRFEVHDAAASAGGVFLAWTMRLVPRLGPTLVIEGTTHARVADGKVVHHRDHWDLLGSLIHIVPVAAPIYRALVARLG